MNYIIGTNSTKTDVFPMQNVPCPACDSQSSLTAVRHARYFHILSIPFFPLGHFATVICSKCQKTFTDNQFTGPMHMILTEREIIFKNRWPAWHFLGVFVVGAFFFFVTCTINFIENVKKGGNAKVKENDLYATRYERDVKQLTNRPDKEADSIACRIKQYVDANVTDELDRFNFKYFTRVKDGRILVLMKVDDLDKVSDEGRKEFISLIEDALYESDYTADKGAYIGILDDFDTELVSTPTYEFTRAKPDPETELYEFYRDEIDTIIKDTIQ
ncbi:hypothetical protein HYN59_09005 [Flavobacterium album]|uniref:Uncharacterized protein n=1 Tax=Flavobacterium album TaxID=2175091 RepID=A0A2S1QXU9_9FLAO|nr:zinc-ribbon domain-containing protein [Flavobacterium album]AWH85247.1 hypothetical protein HYN59_09005 [Flavobacterium album]